MFTALFTFTGQRKPQEGVKYKKYMKKIKFEHYKQKNWYGWWHNLPLGHTNRTVWNETNIRWCKMLGMIEWTMNLHLGLIYRLKCENNMCTVENVWTCEVTDSRKHEVIVPAAESDTYDIFLRLSCPRSRCHSRTASGPAHSGCSYI